MGSLKKVAGKATRVKSLPIEFLSTVKRTLKLELFSLWGISTRRFRSGFWSSTKIVSEVSEVSSEKVESASKNRSSSSFDSVLSFKFSPMSNSYSLSINSLSNVLLLIIFRFLLDHVFILRFLVKLIGLYIF